MDANVRAARRVNASMELLLAFWISALAGPARAQQEANKPLPDPSYCSQRDADPRKCVIDDRPSAGQPVARKKQPQPPPQPSTKR